MSDLASGIEFGSFVPANAASVEGRKSLVIVSYNIRYAVGSFLITGSILRRARLSYPRRRTRLVARHIAEAARALSDGAQALTLEQYDHLIGEVRAIHDVIAPTPVR